MTSNIVLPSAVFLATWLLHGVAVGISYPLLRPLMEGVEPRQRAVLLLALCTLPLALAATVPILGFAPAVGGLIVDKHCHAVTGCWPHVPTLTSDTTRAAAVAAATLSALGTILWLIAARLRRSVSVADALNSVAEQTPYRAFKTLDTSDDVACCVGLLRPQLLISRGLLEKLTEEQLNVVLRHEEAHAARRDNLRNLVANISLWPVPRRLRKAVLHDLVAAGEEACDAAAARSAGNADRVLATLAVLTRDDARADGRIRKSFARETVERRAAALAGGAKLTLHRGTIAAVVIAVYMLCIVGVTDATHHGTEIALEWLD